MQANKIMALYIHQWMFQTYLLYISLLISAKIWFLYFILILIKKSGLNTYLFGIFKSIHFLYFLINKLIIDSLILSLNVK